MDNTAPYTLVFLPLFLLRKESFWDLGKGGKAPLWEEWWCRKPHGLVLLTVGGGRAERKPRTAEGMRLGWVRSPLCGAGPGRAVQKGWTIGTVWRGWQTLSSKWRWIFWTAALWMGKGSRTEFWKADRQDWPHLGCCYAPNQLEICSISAWNLEERACDSPACGQAVRCCHLHCHCLPSQGPSVAPSHPQKPLPAPSPRQQWCQCHQRTARRQQLISQPLDQRFWLNRDPDWEGEELRTLLRPPPGTGGTSTNAQWTAKSYIIDLSDVFAYK